MRKPRRKQIEIYLNDKQKAFLDAPQKVKKFLGGRAVGKTNVIGERKYNCAAKMPRAKTFLSSTTFAQILTKTLPEMQSAWSRHGLKEDLHYVIGRKPPKGYVSPLKPPKKYENIISFGNGYCIELLSMDRPDLSRGGSYDGGDIDEDLLVKEEAFNRVILPTVRGNRERFGHIPEHGQVCLYGSVPWRVDGNWVLKFEDKAKEMPNHFFFLEAQTQDNIAVLGLEYIEMLKRTLPWMEYQVEVLNRRLVKLPDGFYHKFEPERHCRIDTFDYGTGEKGITVLGDKDVDPNSPIDFTLDFGGRINCGLAIQTRRNPRQKRDQINVLREFYVKDDEKLRELAGKFCTHYATHKKKHVFIYGEPRGNDRQPDGEPLFLRLQSYFRQYGWSSEVLAGSSSEDHLTRHNLITEIFQEEANEMPLVRINQNNCKNFIIVLQTTRIKDDFKKDKSKEKDPNFPQEEAPHLGDAFDNYVTQKFPHLLNSDGSFWIGNDTMVL